MGIWYASREDVIAALDINMDARQKTRIARALQSATESVEGQLNRKFYPTVATRYFDWPPRALSYPWRLWLDANELVSITTLTAGGVVISSSDYFLEPNEYGPPYDRIEIDLSATSASFQAGDTFQRSIAVTGVFGFTADDDVATTISANITTTTATSCSLTDSSAVGVGNLIRIGTERMLVTEKTMVTTSQTLQSALTASKSDVTVVVTTGSAYSIGELLLLDSERMEITDIAGNNLTVLRAVQGTVLATHSGSTIYAPRQATLVRGSYGTTAATHTSGDTVYVNRTPGLVKALTLAEAVNTLEQETSGYVRTVGSGETARNASGGGLEDIRNQAYTQYGRKTRMRAV